MSITKILFATHNQNKLSELVEIAKNINEKSMVQFLTLKDFNEVIEPIESGSTFKENATIKAKYYYELFKIPVLADDSGLVCSGLNNAPGVFSARYASKEGRNATDSDNVSLLLKNIQQVVDKKAKFLCTVCYYDGNDFIYASGALEGTIQSYPKGQNGFGYDPIFFLKAYNKTLAELNSEIKNQISHRRLALEQMFECLKIRNII